MWWYNRSPNLYLYPSKIWPGFPALAVTWKWWPCRSFARTWRFPTWYVVAGSSNGRMFKHCQDTVIDLLLKRAVSQICQNLWHDKNIFFNKKMWENNRPMKSFTTGMSQLGQSLKCPEIPLSDSPTPGTSDWLPSFRSRQIEQLHYHKRPQPQSGLICGLQTKSPCAIPPAFNEIQKASLKLRCSKQCDSSLLTINTPRAEQWNFRQGSSMPKLWRPMSLAGLKCLIWWPPWPSRNCACFLLIINS